MRILKRLEDLENGFLKKDRKEIILKQKIIRLGLNVMLLRI